METEKGTVTEGAGKDTETKQDGIEQTEQVGSKIENLEDVSGSRRNEVPDNIREDQEHDKEEEEGVVDYATDKREGTPEVSPEVSPEGSTEGTPEGSTESSEFIEFEFSPVKKAPPGRDGSVSPDVEDMLDQLYEAARKGDSGKVCNLIFSGNDENKCSETGEDGDVDAENIEGGCSKRISNSQNQAIINLLKRKTPIEKDLIVADKLTPSKKRKVEAEKVIDFTNVKNVRNLDSLPVFNLLNVVSQETKFKRRKNPYRTPTPPNLSPTPEPFYKPRITVQNILNSYGNIQQPPTKTSQPKRLIPIQPKVEKNLIDYSVLTKALTKTLESKLKEGEDNDVKIVIFCNNKPIQSFSVKSNAKTAAATSLSEDPTSPKDLQVSSPQQTLTCDETEKLLKVPVETVANVSDILSHNLNYLSKQYNQNLGLPANNIPTIGDVKAILERNKKIATESLARLSKNRTRTLPITSGMLLKDFQTRNSDSDTDVSSTALIKKQETEENDSGERNLVINETVGTDENCSESVDEVHCDQCNKSFKQQRYLNRHRIRVHGSSKQAFKNVSPKGSELLSKSNKPVADLFAKPGKNAFKNSNSTSGDENIASDKEKLDGTVHTKMSDNESDSEEVVVKAEPVSDTEDKEIQSLLADDQFINLLETADKNKRALFTRNSQHHGVLAKDILNDNYKGKSFKFDYSPPVTEEGLVEPVYVCEQCGKFYRARKSLKDHFLREHAKDIYDEPLYLYITGNKYQCPICFNNYHSGSELVSHTKKHTGELRSVCKLCGKVYSSVHVLRRHIDNIHADVRPRPFRCELCDYAASNKWHLKEHYRRHTGEQPFKCPICMKPFSHQGTMNRHCKTVHKVELPTQRPFPRNNICDLPDLPKDGEDSEPFQGNVESPETSLPDSPSEENELQVDLSIVKTEAEDVDIDN